MKVEDLYLERNAAVLAFAHAAQIVGWTVGRAVDADDWPVLIVDTPAGQLAWHLPVWEMPDTIPAYPRRFGGGAWPEVLRRRVEQLRLAGTAAASRGGAR